MSDCPEAPGRGLDPVNLEQDVGMSSPLTGLLHHVKLWVPDLDRTVSSWGWLLAELGYQPFQRWPDGVSFRMGPTYLVFERSPDQASGPHERTRPGVNHLAFHAADRVQVDALATAAAEHGWSLLLFGPPPARGRTRARRRLPGGLRRLRSRDRRSSARLIPLELGCT